MTDHTAPTVKLDTVVDGKYLIKKHLGAGAMGEVYLAQHIAMGSLVALKVLRNVLDMPVLQQASEEARILSDLNHPNIAKVIGIGITGHRLYMVMQFVEGESLADRIKRDGALKPQAAWPILLSICAAAQYLSEQNIVHRDIKPSNILISKDNHSYLVDFGVATRVNTGQTLTGQQGQLVGSALYIPPEICGGSKATAASDIYSFGCLMYEVLTGEPPYKGDSAMEIMMSHMKSTLPQMPAFAENVLRKTLQKIPADRYASFSELAEELKAIEQSGFKQQEPTRRLLKSKQKTGKSLPPFVLLCLAVVLCAAIFIACEILTQPEKIVGSEVGLDRTLRSGSAADYSTDQVTDLYPEWKAQLDPFLGPTDRTSASNKAKAYCMLIRGAASSGNLADLNKYCPQYLALNMIAPTDYLTSAVGEILGSKNRTKYMHDAQFIGYLEKLVQQEETLGAENDDMYAIMGQLARALDHTKQTEKSKLWYHRALERTLQGNPSLERYVMAEECVNQLVKLDGFQSVEKYMSRFISCYVSLTPEARRHLKKDPPAAHCALLHSLCWMLMYSRNRDFFDDALIVCEMESTATKDPAEKITWLLRSGEMYNTLGNTKPLMAICKQIEELSRINKIENLDIAHIELIVSNEQFTKKNYAEALRRRRLAVKIALATGITAGSATSTLALGQSLEQAGAFAEAEKYYQMAYDFSKELITETKNIKGRDAEITPIHAMTTSCAYALMTSLAKQHKIANMQKLYDEHVAFGKALNVQNASSPEMKALYSKYSPHKDSK